MAWDRRMRAIFGVTVWLAAAAGAWILYKAEPAPPVAVAIAESREHRVSPVRLGRLVALEVTEGQRIAPGQVIARFETATARQEVSVARAQLQQAAAAVRATGGAFDSEVLQAGRNFREEVEAAELELGNARSSFARDRAEHAKLAADLERERNLVERGLTKSDRLVSMDQRRSVIEESVKVWPARIQTLEARARGASRRLADWEKAHAEGSEASRGTQLQPLQAKVREQEESLQLLNSQIDQSVLRATVHSYVSLIHARPGDVVKPGDPVATLVEAMPRQVLAYVDERRGAPLPRGTRVVATQRGTERRQWEGVVSAVSAGVTELPKRLWVNPAYPAWGRAMYITLPPEASLAPGEMLDVSPLPGSAPSLASTK